PVLLAGRRFSFYAAVDGPPTRVPSLNRAQLEFGIDGQCRAEFIAARFLASGATVDESKIFMGA
ncbi:MAG TPA: hypothetical protein VLA73_02580, partial [Burkholderiales bacterium]|nr:hypothetical protein [Burkholderiales bacterium]